VEEISTNSLGTELQKVEMELARAESIAPLLDEASRPATKAEVLSSLTAMLVAFSNHGKGDTAKFGALLIADITESRPSIAALKIGCRTVRQTSEFFPTVAAVFKAIAAVDESIADFRKQLGRLQRHRERLLKAKDARDAEVDRERHYQRRRDCMAALRAGDDVSRFDAEMVEGCRRMLGRLA